jgi:DNA-binding MarR family transcriptional regulator
MHTKYGRKYYIVTNNIHNQILDFDDISKRGNKLGRVECILLQFLITQNRPVVLKEIKEYINVSNSRITHLTDALIAKGYIVRSPSPNDRRTYIIEITPSGHEIAQSFQHKQIKIYEEFLNEIPDEIHDQMFDLLNNWRIFLKNTKKKKKK